VTEGVFTQQSFTTHGERVERVLEEVLARTPADAAWRILDVGCADGGTLLALAEARPEASFVGIDVALPSIAAAEGMREALDTPERFSFVVGDYLATPLDGPFDLVIADQSLHLVQGDDDALARRLAADVGPGGLLVAEMPYAGLFNRGLVGARRVLRRFRGPALDRAGLAIARRLHADDMPDEQLQERLVYLYVVPERLASDAWERRLAAHGLDRLSHVDMRHASPAQLRHDLRVYRKQ
jgi:trans-aconitate 2-methyltransferase